ncbi:raffinose/stachyose/melibiose transport system permease protein [Anaerocolumna jejuensis DSM 15929]|uniref:Raffinose/stachyose/melibiose transport system permease protein n=1 Tax=Anaerocolumna jejuensis DSM 15929 TaxID=1121322 RepID=A0A1M6VM11_9FIRM|nr:sugar ABC transporter permease [Anaerocolumna jejuensis]SHK82391.1 raffinose/stachyose/melibiose transport system permease protein [Anaerocolumna jejuensis DSM 15929]
MKKVSASRLERKNYKWIYLFLTPSILVFLLFYLSPIITVITTSFTKWDGFNKPEFIGLQNYITMFHNEAFLLSLKNLLLWSLIAATLHVGFGILVAFVLFRKPFGWKFTRAVFMVPNVISAAAWALIYKFIFNNDMGVLNNIIRKVNPDFNVQWFYQSPYAFCAVTLTWLFYAVIVTLIVLNDLMAIPEELHEAAKVDGATGWKVITKIQLPLCRNAFGTAIICSVTARVAMYEQIALTTAGGPGDDTMNLPLILVKSISDMKYGYANANGVIMFILGLLILAIINKVFRMNENVY